MKEVQKTFKDEKSNQEEDEFGDDLEKMEDAEKNLISEINIEEKNFRMEINEQRDRINKINTDIKRIDFKIKNLKQEKKLDEIKNKTRTKGRSTTKYQPKSNSKNTKNMEDKDIKRRLSNYKKRSSPNDINNLKNTKINYIDKRINLRTPNLIVKEKEKITKPFEIKKFNDLSNNNKSRINNDKNYTMFNENKKSKLPIFHNNIVEGDNKSTNYERNIRKKSNKGISALKEIESLKIEIQNALKNKIVTLNDNENAIDENNIIHNKINHQKNDINNFSSNKTGKFENQINILEKEEEQRANIGNNNLDNNLNKNLNYNNDDKKSICLQNETKVKDYQINGNDKSNEEASKRKPFDKIIFK